ncbi:glycosyltransferase family 4 protein [Nocardioides sp. MH1]|uniref:glycosyltransferase family 4 protein n=1 Tax=Nocardioides sp. MH1 TaxID=3242490 RepID=UPI00352030F5
MQRDDFEVKRFPGIESVGVSDSGSRLRVAIVTEEIIGPVRNGGIASTYYHLAKGLAAEGHEVHVLFLKGAVVQDETPEFWVDRYAEFGVTLHYLSVPDSKVWASSPTWQARYAAAYEWLRDQEPFDVVHTSEWRGGLVYALMAKRLGLAFRDTLFLVKTSSPHIWNRHYQMLPITDTNLVAAAYAEQKCVELADVVIGGSAHLLSFMERIGYRLPPANVFVQPNIVDFSNVPVLDRRPGEPRRHGDVVRSRDLVFFGRLEARKGIEIFCSAIDLLHERGEVPDSVTFLGKWGGRLAAQGGLSPEQYIREKAETWSCPITIINDKNQPEALTFLTERDRIAVMPSLIENSTMAVYETLEQRVPFIATAVGGTPELIAEDDHAACLVEPTAQALAERLETALRDGQPIAHPAFSNEANLEVWYGYHAHLADLVEQHGRTEAVASLLTGVDQPGSRVQTVSQVALVRRDDSLEDLVKACHAATPDELVLGYTDPHVRVAIEKVAALLDEACPAVRVVNCIGQTSGTALNTLALSQTCDAMVVSDGLSALPQDGFFDAVREALTHRPRVLFTTFFATDGTTVGLPLGGDVATQFLTSRGYGPELFAVRADTFATIGTFEPYDARHGVVHEYVTRAAEAGHDLLVLPEQLLSWPSAELEATAYAADQLYGYLKAKPLIDASPLAQRKVVLAALSGAAGRPVGTVDEWMLRTDSVDPAQPQWLMPAMWGPESKRAAAHRRVIFGVHTAKSEIWLYARGPGERRFRVRGDDVAVELVATRGVEGTEDYTTLSVFPVPTVWTPATSYPLLWSLHDGDEELISVFLRVNKVGARTFSLSGRAPALSARLLAELMEKQPDEQAGPTLWSLENAPSDPAEVEARSAELVAAGPGPRPAAPGSGLRSPERRGGWAVGDWLSGWAWDRQAPDRVLHVAVRRGEETLLVVPADVVDRSLEDVPGRGAHAYRIPVLPAFVEGDDVHLVLWEDGSPVYRGGLHVDRVDGTAGPRLRRVQADQDPPPVRSGRGEPSRKKRSWWGSR